MADNLNYPLRTRQGNSFSKIMRYKTRETSTSTPVSGLLAGDVIQLTVKWPDTDPLQKYLTYDVDTGEIIIALTVAETRSMPAGAQKVRYEVELFRGADTEITILAGPLIVDKGINADD